MDRHFSDRHFSTRLPERANIEHLKEQAKDLLRQYHLGNSQAINRFHERCPRRRKGIGNTNLAEAQLVVAREYGFESWPKLRVYVASLKVAGKERAMLKRAMSHLRAGKLCIIFDDEGRENEGDFVLAAESASPEAINFITKHGRGTLCLALTEEHAAKLKLWPINSQRTSVSEPAFLNSIDAAHGITTGVSAFDRASTILAAVREDVRPEDLKSPGHIFPLRAVSGGLQVRRGHTEGSIALVEMAGLKPAAVICEIMNDDGSMARWPDLEKLAQEHDLPILKISDLL